MSEKTKALLKLTVTATLLVAAFKLINFKIMLAHLKEADLKLLAVAVLALIAGAFAGCLSWFLILRMRWPDFRFKTALAAYWSGMFFNSFLPSNVGGDVVKGYLVTRAQGATGFVVASLVLDRIVNMGILTCIGVTALLIELEQKIWASLFCAALGIALLASHLFAKRLRRTVPTGKWAAWLDPLLELAGTPQRLFPVLGAAFCSQLLKTLQNVFVILALQLAVPLFCVWYVIPLFGIVSALPVSVGGLGLREMVAQGLAGHMELDNTHLVALSLVGHLTVVAVNMLGAIPFFFVKSKQNAR